MRQVDASARSMPEISMEKLCFVIAKARELSSDDDGMVADAANPSDDGMARERSGTAYATTRRELAEFIADLDEDEAAALVAMTWIGRGDFEPEDWPKAVAEALERRERPPVDYLLGTPLLSDYLEEALSAFDRSCEGVETGQEPESGQEA